MIGSTIFNRFAHIQIPPGINYWEVESEVEPFAAFNTYKKIEIHEEVVNVWIKGYATFVIGRQTKIVCEPVTCASIINMAAGNTDGSAIIVTA